MKAIRFDGERVSLDDIPVPERAGEALVRVLTAGVCNTDLEIVRGYAGFRGTLGHEFVGVVERSPTPDLVGTRIVGEINCGCGRCALCEEGDPRHCRDRTVLGIVNRDGAFGEYVSLPVENLVRVPDSIATDQAVFAEPLAAACEILEQVAIVGEMRVALIGDGKLAQLIGRVLATTGASIRVFGRHEAKLVLLEECGLRTALSADVLNPDGSATSDVRASFDVVVEASGSSSGFAFAQDLVRPRGTIVLKSTIKDDVPFDARRLIVDEVTLVGSRCGRLATALALLESGRVSVSSLISARMSIDDGGDVIKRAESPGTLKVLVTVSEE
jgi:threonine dehydrogenase-like Zn-dependent dehydrogenase